MTLVVVLIPSTATYVGSSLRGTTQPSPLHIPIMSEWMESEIINGGLS